MAIRTVAVSREDCIDAFVYTQENPGGAVLRVTPPFHGRMRARLHVYRSPDAKPSKTVWIHPEQILEQDVVDAYPSLAPAVDAEGVYKDHTDAIDRWRDSAFRAFCETIEIDVPDGRHQIAVTPLG